MRYLLTLLTVCWLVPHAEPVLGADSLFSQVPIDSVFAPAGTPAAANSENGWRELPPPLRLRSRLQSGRLATSSEKPASKQKI